EVDETGGAIRIVYDAQHSPVRGIEPGGDDRAALAAAHVEGSAHRALPDRTRDRVPAERALEGHRRRTTGQLEAQARPAARELHLPHARVPEPERDARPLPVDLEGEGARPAERVGADPPAAR